MTALLNGQAMNFGLASIKVTLMRGAICLTKRAQVAPAKPPPTTTTRPPVPCASAGIGNSAAPAAAVLRKSRRLVCLAVMIDLLKFLLVAFSAENRHPLFRKMLLILQRAIPGGNRLDLVVGKSLGNAVHHRGGQLPRLEALHRGHDVGGASRAAS